MPRLVRIVFVGCLVAALLQPTLPANASPDEVCIATLGWEPAGKLAAPRIAHAAARLHNDQVLVTGGYDAGPTSHAEMWTSVDDWETVPPMAVRRWGHTATTLSDGRVLVVGGQAPMSPTETVELFDPMTRTWRAGASMSVRRVYHSATLLSDGRVLIAGGISPSPRSAEIYDPRTDTWTVAGSMSAERHFHTATRLDDGRVLVTGGEGNGVNHRSVDLFDPGTMEWTSVAAMHVIRFSHAAALLPSGDVLVAGGSNYNEYHLTSAEVFSPTTGTWRVVGSLEQGRTFPETAEDGDAVLFAGGQVTGTVPTATTERFDPHTETWSAGPTMISPRYRFSLTSLRDGQALAVGGYKDFSNRTATAEMLRGEPRALPSAPLELSSSTQPGEAQALLTWSTPESSGDCTLNGYRVYKINGDATRSLLAELPATTTSFIYEGHVREKVGFAVTAVSRVGEGPETVLDCIVLGVPPSPGTQRACEGF